MAREALKRVQMPLEALVHGRMHPIAQSGGFSLFLRLSVLFVIGTQNDRGPALSQAEVNAIVASLQPVPAT